MGLIIKQITKIELFEKEKLPPQCYQTNQFKEISGNCKDCQFIKGCATWNFYDRLIERKTIKKSLIVIILENPITWMIFGGFINIGIITVLRIGGLI